MNKRNAWWHLNQSIKESRFVSRDQLHDVLSILILHAEWVVEQHKLMRDYHKKNDKDFKYWQHICAIERGENTVIVRWRKFQGKRLYSEPLSTSDLSDYKIPMSRFKGCSANEKRTILVTENHFSTIRRINEKLSTIAKSHQALFDMTRERYTDKSLEKTIKNRLDLPEVPLVLSDSSEFTEEQRMEFRKKIGL
jgi:hypothetical protein